MFGKTVNKWVLCVNKWVLYVIKWGMVESNYQGWQILWKQITIFTLQQQLDQYQAYGRLLSSLQCRLPLFSRIHTLVPLLTSHFSCSSLYQWSPSLHWSPSTSSAWSPNPSLSGLSLPCQWTYLSNSIGSIHPKDFPGTKNNFSCTFMLTRY